MNDALSPDKPLESESPVSSPRRSSKRRSSKRKRPSSRKKSEPAKRRRWSPRKKQPETESAEVVDLAEVVAAEAPTRPARRLTRSERNILWIEEHCVVPEGKYVGEPVRLTKKQKKWMGMIYDTPTRTFILSMGRKGGKTAFLSFLLLLHLCGPEALPNSQLFSTAQSRDQAALVFNYAAKCVRLSPLSHFVTIRDTAKQLLCPELGTLYRALSAEVSTAYGLSPVFTVHDELGQVRGPRSELYEALETASAAQQAPLSIIISTQAPSPDDLLSMLIDDALSEKGDERTKVQLYAAPDDVDPFSEEAIRAANPHFDELMNKDEVLRQAEDARRLPSREAAFRNLILNQRVESRAPSLVTRKLWDENGAPPAPLAKKKVYGGLDLSAVSDLTALVLLSEQYDVVPTFWIPEEGLVERSRSDRVPYDKWVEQGFLLTTPGRTVAYEFVAEYLRGVFDSFDVRALAFDRYNMRFLRPWLITAGFSDDELSRFVEFGQGFVSMSPAIRETEALLLEAKLKHGKHPVLSMCAANATTVLDPAGNRKFIKTKVTGRIDGMVALTMAVGAMTGGAAPGASAPKKFQIFFV